MRQCSQKARRPAAFAMAIWMAAFFFSFMPASAETGRTIRVALLPQEGIAGQSESGSWSGTVIDFLDEISNYTGWQYEYIQVTQRELEASGAGEQFDLVGGVRKLPELEGQFVFPTCAVGYHKAFLVTQRDNAAVLSFEKDSFQGKTIGVYKEDQELAESLTRYLAANELDCGIEYYSRQKAAITGETLSSLLQDGSIDMALDSLLEDPAALRELDILDTLPYYIASSKQEPGLLEELEQTLHRIYDSNPSFAETAYHEHFSHHMTSVLFFNQEEKEYIRENPVVTVAVPKEWHPIFCPHTPDFHQGVLPDLLDEISSLTSLEFTYVYSDSYLGMLELVQQREADVAGFFLDPKKKAAQMGLALTQPYATMTRVLIRRKGASYPAPGLTGAVVDGREMPQWVQVERLQTYESITDALKAVNKGDVDLVYALSNHAEPDIQKYHLSNLIITTMSDSRNPISFALPKPANPQLFSILNKAVSELSEDTKSLIMEKNVFSIGESRLDLADLVYANPNLFVSLAIILLLLIVTFIFIWSRARMRAAAMSIELKKAEAESRARSEFLSRMSHELRTPMNAVVGLADLAGMQAELPGPVKETLSKLRSASHYLLSLINDILDIGRIDRGKIALSKEPFSLHQMLDDLQGLMAVEAARRNLHFSIERDLTHDHLLGDSIRLCQVLTNLLSNAFKFTSAGGKVRLRVQETGWDEQGASFYFSVRDNGAGVPREDQERIFDMFEQLGNSRSKSQGIGLGLPICRSLVELMGGLLELDSQVGKGSDFYFTIYLPFGRHPEKTGPSSASRCLLEGARLLLAEDNDLNAEIASELLKIEGAKVLRVRNGKEAVRAFRESEPGEIQAVLMDIRMPVMDGLRAARFIRILPRQDAKTVPIIAMTANSLEENIETAKMAGMNAFLSKPVDVNILYNTLRGLLNPTLPEKEPLKDSP